MEGNPTLVTSLEGLIKISSSEKPGIIAAFTIFSLRGPCNRNYVWFLGTCQPSQTHPPNGFCFLGKEKRQEKLSFIQYCVGSPVENLPDVAYPIQVLWFHQTTSETCHIILIPLNLFLALYEQRPRKIGHS